MNFTIHIRPEAEIDIEEASLWYQKQQVGLGDKFLDEIQQSVKRIGENPYLYLVVHKNVRRTLLHKFPFALYYFVEENSLIIIAVMHGSRHPKRWQKRA